MIEDIDIFRDLEIIEDLETVRKTKVIKERICAFEKYSDEDFLSYYRYCDLTFYLVSI